MTYSFKTCYVVRFLFLLGYLVISLIIVEYIKTLQTSFTPSKDNLEINKFLKDPNFISFQGERTVHLDLKGAPPSIDYLKSIFPLFQALGITSLLIEYEDVFPFRDKYLRAVNAYSKDDIKLLLQTAQKYDLNVIPLIQTFGHLEFLLKLKKFSHLREEFEYPQSVCPSHNDTFPILTHLLDEVIDVHPHIRYVHIGCDEVYQLGLCEKCQETMLSKYWGNDELFLDHVTRLAKYIRSKYPSITPLMWDDQLRSISVDKLKKFDIGALVEPVVWFYQPVVSFSSDMWKKYGDVFSSIWIASSFKGATGSDKIITDLNYHVKNQISWMYIMRQYANVINFKGVIITGWQRYDHFAILCELLPVSVPSLVHVALVLDGTRSRRTDVFQKIKNVIVCGSNNDFFRTCEFPGVNIYLAVLRFSQLKTEIDYIFMSSPVRGWLTAYNVETKYFSKLLAEKVLKKIKESQISLKHTISALEGSLETVYDKYTITEWMKTNVQPYFLQLNRTSTILHNLANVTEWGPRYGDLISNN